MSVWDNELYNRLLASAEHWQGTDWVMTSVIMVCRLYTYTDKCTWHFELRRQVEYVISFRGIYFTFCTALKQIQL
jgi:hypothetical protein